MEKITLSKAKDEVLGSLIAAFGVVAGSVIMKMAKKYNLNPWLIPALGLIGGIGVRVSTTNENAKDFGTGLLIAGSLDLTKKALDMVATKWPMAQSFSDSVPTLSGPSSSAGYTLPFSDIQNGLRGYNLRGSDQMVPAQVVGSQLLR